MKRDTQNKTGVSKSNARTAPIGESRSATAPQQVQVAAAPTPCTISARYIDSRLKQFCLR